MRTEDGTSVQRQLIGVPRPRGPRVQRSALLRRLESAAEPLVLLVAPSGFGKTNLLAEWAATTDAQVAWLSCDESDEDPAQFWSRLAASLAARWPAMGSDAALILERPSWGPPELVDSLARDLADLPAEAAVVIDDAQFAEPSQRDLAGVAQRLPGHVRILVATQHNPVYSTSRLRLAGVITELRADDLAFSQVEVEQLLELQGVAQQPVLAAFKQRLGGLGPELQEHEWDDDQQELDEDEDDHSASPTLLHWAAARTTRASPQTG